MTVNELKALIKEILLEAVPFDKATDIEHELRKKYDELEGYTFGVEFEFEPVIETEYLSRDDIAKKLSDKFGMLGGESLSRDYYDWITDQRNSAAASWSRRYGTLDTINNYDDSYGPMSVDTFEESIKEPQIDDYSTEEEYNDAYNEYEEKKDEVESDYSYWERRNNIDDYIDEFISMLVRANTWTDYLDEEEFQVKDMEGSIDNAYEFINSLGENVRKDDKPDSTTWAVGEDGPNVEIRSRHMSQTGHDFDIISKVGNWVSDQATSGKTGMHIHIGVPRDFDMFDVLAMSTLVDEETIKKEVSVDRDFSSYAKFRRTLVNNIFSRIYDYMRRTNDVEKLPKSFILTNAQVKELMAHFDRNHGTNIQAFSEHKTIEFRYLGSDIAYKVLRWINYFLLLPRIAKSRNQIKLDSIYGETLVATRLPGKIQFTYLASKTLEPKREKVPMPKEPADVIKQKAFELPSKLDVAKQQLAAKKQQGTQ